MQSHRKSLSSRKLDDRLSGRSQFQTIRLVVLHILITNYKDGKAAGQSIPHIHIHIIPRRFEGDKFQDANDNIYPAIEEFENKLPKVQSLRVDNEDRVARKAEEMEAESKWLQSFFD